MILHVTFFPCSIVSSSFSTAHNIYVVHNFSYFFPHSLHSTLTRLSVRLRVWLNPRPIICYTTSAPSIYFVALLSAIHPIISSLQSKVIVYRCHAMIKFNIPINFLCIHGAVCSAHTLSIVCNKLFVCEQNRA